MFSFEKGSNCQNHSYSGSLHLVKKIHPPSSHSKISDSPHPLPLFGKPCINGTNFFFNSKKPYFQGYFRLFPKSKNFSRLYHFFIIKKQTTCTKFHKISISCFLEKVVLINWLTGWQWCFHKNPFCLKTRVQQYH